MELVPGRHYKGEPFFYETSIINAKEQYALKQWSRNFMRLQLSPSSLMSFVRPGEKATQTNGSLGGTQKKPDSNWHYWDIASLTKTVTALSALLTVREGYLHLHSRISDFHPVGELQPEATLADLLRHTSGIMGKVVYDKKQSLVSDAQRWRKVFESLDTYTLAPEGLGGHQYRDTNFLLLGFILEHIHGKSIQAINEETVRSVGIHTMRYVRKAEVGSQLFVAAQRALENGQVMPSGIPQDEKNILLDGPAGHAGMFATHNALVQYAEAWLENAWDFSHEELAQMYGLQDSYDSANPRTFGLVWRRGVFNRFPNMSGFSGQAIILDPIGERALVHNTQLTYPDRPDPKKREVFQNFHSQIFHEDWEKLRF